MGHPTRTRLAATRDVLRAAFVTCALVAASCASDGIRGDDGLPVGAGPDARPPQPGEPDAMSVPDATPPSAACNMTGRWIAELHTVSRAFGFAQRATNYFFYDITQAGDRFTINRALHCGFIVEGTTSVSLGDAPLEAVAATEYAGPGRQGTFKETADGKCEFSLDRMYNIRGANKATYLTDTWKVGDPPKPLSAFTQLSKVPPGIEDWDMDGKHGITLTTGLGPRYVAQRDWNEHAGIVAQFANQFGGETAPGNIVVKWDSQEAVSDQTRDTLRTTATPDGNGWSRFARADDLTVVDSGAHADLTTCRNAQKRARDIW